MRDNHLAVYWLAVIVAGFVITQCTEPGRAHDIYGGWHVPGNPQSSCCNDADCRPTRARQREDGNWEAWDGFAWLRIPPSRVLPTDYAGDGRSHLCEKGGHVYCFSPTQPKG